VTKRKNYIWAELKLPTRIPDRIARIGAIIERLDGNPRYATLQPIVNALKPAYAELRAAQVDVTSGTRGKPAVRDRKLVVCEQLLEQLRVGVEGLANDDLENGPSLIEGAFMFVRGRSTRKKQPEALGPGSLPGSVKMSILAMKGAGSYVREWSADGGVTWTRARVTPEADAVIPDLPIGKFVLFRWAALTKTGLGDWSEPIGIVVK